MALLATIKDLQDFTGVYEQEENSQSKLFLGSASDIIRNYLGYDPELKNYKKAFNGNGQNYLRLETKPIQKINEVEINGVVEPLEDFYFDDDTLFYKDGFIPEGIKNVRIDFDSGFETIPDLIKLTCLRIAAILATEADQNIGITSKSFGESGSRTFYNFTNFNKYLLPLSKWKLIG